MNGNEMFWSRFMIYIDMIVLNGICKWFVLFEYGSLYLIKNEMNEKENGIIVSKRVIEMIPLLCNTVLNDIEETGIEM